MERFTEMSTIHSSDENERYKLVQEKYVPCWRDSMGGEFRGQKEGDIITVLHDKKKHETIMSDSVMEKRTNVEFVDNANGDVLIGGLGIGMIVLAIQNKPEVKSITVVEIDADLKELVMRCLKKHLNDKVKIIISDIHNFIPEKKYDIIYCDIWNNISGDNWEEMKQLTKKFKYQINRENENSSLSHWRKEDMRKLSY